MELINSRQLFCTHNSQHSNQDFTRVCYSTIKSETIQQLQSGQSVSEHELEIIKYLVESDETTLNQIQECGIVTETYRQILHKYPNSRALPILQNKLKELNLFNPVNAATTSVYTHSNDVSIQNQFSSVRPFVPISYFYQTYLHSYFPSDSSCHAYVNNQMSNAYVYPTETTVTLQDALSVVPEFDGTTPPFLTFADGCNEAKNMITHLVESNLVCLIKNKLRGAARDLTQGRIFNSVEELISFLQNYFSPFQSLTQLQGELSRIVQSQNENVIEYGNRARNLMLLIFEAYAQSGGTQINFRFELEQEVIRCFTRGLHKEIYINPNKYNTLDSVIIAAIDLEKENHAINKLHEVVSTKSKVKLRENANTKINAVITENRCCRKYGLQNTLIENRAYAVNNCKENSIQEKFAHKNLQNESSDTEECLDENRHSHNANNKITPTIILRRSLKDLPFTLMIDTGAEINIIKEKSLTGEDKIDRTKTCKISGVANGTIQTLGQITIKMFNENILFHVVNPSVVAL